MIQIKICLLVFVFTLSVTRNARKHLNLEKSMIYKLSSKFEKST